MEKPAILIIEDSVELAKLLRLSLEDEGFSPRIAASGQAALVQLQHEWDLVILDLMLPDIPGEDLLKHAIRRGDHPPILVLTACNRQEDKLRLFRAGCDDYMTKPFDVEELCERSRALLRRFRRSPPISARYADMILDPETFELSVEDERVALTPKEAAILQLLMAAPERVVTRRELLQTIWGLSREPETNFLGVHLLNLRKKLSQVDREEWLQTIRGSGVMLKQT